MSDRPKLHLIDDGSDRPPLLLLSSIGTAAEMWDTVAGRLEETFRVIRADAPGHGGSPDPPEGVTIEAIAEAVGDALDDRGVQRCSVWGLSMGGMIAMRLALDSPARVDRLLLSSTALGFGAPDAWNGRAAKVRSEGLESIADMVMERYFSAPFRESSPDAVAQVRQRFLEISPEGYARCCEAIARWDLQEAGSIAVPTRVLAGELDEATPVPINQAVADAIPSAELHVLDGCGHVHTIERPDASVDAALDHLG